MSILLKRYFSRTEIILWCASVCAIVLSFALFDRESYLTLLASLVGVTSLVYNAKGNPFGQLLMILFSILYGIISYSFRYYGEMITYLLMTMPMAILAFVSWLRNPHNGKRHEVRIETIGKKECAGIWALTLSVTVAFYFILAWFETKNLLASTLSVSTSFLAAYLTFRRSPYFALAYAANDIVLIVLWILAGMTDTKYLSVTVCFLAFLASDLYGFVSWRKMKARQVRERKYQR